MKLLSFIVVCIIECVLGSNNVNSDKLLSPRTVKTKYGSLRGLLISLSEEKFSNLGDPSVQTTAKPSSSSSASNSQYSGSHSQNTPQTPLSTVEAFLGVPYASAPTGSLRFMPPVTLSHWRGTRLANKMSPVCPQKLPSVFTSKNGENGKASSNQRTDGHNEYFARISPYLENESEDCLYLNIYLPFQKEPGKSKLPVMMFVHGESYFWGTGNAYDGTVLASYGDVVVITLNYRLGIFGFLPTVIDGTLRGNYGLMDIIAALHWIHDNINEIGGDSGNVTLVGHNRGASFVNLLMLSPMGRGLFAKAILMSGAALSSWSLATDAESHAKYVAKAVNCPNYDNILMVDCLRTKMMDELLKIDVQSDDAFRTSFGPIIDGLVVPSEPRHLMESENDSSHHLSYMYPNMRANTALSGRTTPHHLMYGVTRVESPLLFTSDEEKHGIDFERRDDILRTLVRNVVNYYQEVISLTLINEYTDWSVPSEHPINILDSLIDILGDALVVAPITSVANMHFKQQQQRYHALEKKPNDASANKADGPKVFSYVFVYQSESNGYSARLGCVHGDELPYVFGAPLAHFYLQKTLGFFPPNYTKPEVTLSETVMFQWSNFVKYGNPNGKGNVDKERFESVFWPEFDIVQRKYLMIGMKPKIRDHYHSHRLSFWLNLIPKLEKHGKEESDHLKRHLQDQGTLEEREVSVFERISLKFLSSLQTPGGQKSTFGSQSSSSVTQLDKSTTPTNAINAVYDYPLTVFNGSGNSSDSRSAIVHQTVYYSTALTITIGVGIFLLVLNVLVFVGVYYHLNKHKKVNAKKYPRVNYADVGQQQSSQANSLQAAQCGQYCCDNHHHLCTFNSNELTGNYVGNCGSSDVTVHCALTDEKLCQCGNCHCSAAAAQNVCDRSHCLSIIHEFDEHL